MELAIRDIKGDGELEQAYGVLHELRTELTWEVFLKIYEQARKADGYTVTAGWLGSRMVAVMGHRVLHDFVHGKHLYIDDLVVAADARGQGLGAQLLEEARGIAIEKSCTRLRLSTGIQNADAMRFYEREGWLRRSVTYKQKV